jgi:hypothetical protein
VVPVAVLRGGEEEINLPWQGEPDVNAAKTGSLMDYDGTPFTRLDNVCSTYAPPDCVAS